jgi:hypothetical protein
MQVAIEFNTICPATQQRTRFSSLRNVSLDQALCISAALQGRADVEAVIVVEGDREPARLARMLRRLRSAAGFWLGGAGQLRPQAGAARPVPGRLAAAG